MHGQSKAKTPAEYIAGIPEPRKADIAALDQLIRKSCPTLEPVMYMGMLGYGPFHYKYATGREGEACRVALANNKAYISLYCLAADKAGYVAERFKTKLPKANIGKSCVRFKKLADVDIKVLAELLKITAKTSFGKNEVTKQ